MIYCIVEGKTDSVILSAIFESKLAEMPKMIVSKGVPSMPAIVRTILSFIDDTDKVLAACDQDSFDDVKYQKEMLGFLLRGAMNNPHFKMFTFNPNIDILIPKQNREKGWKTRTKELSTTVINNIDKISENETIQEILKFLKTQEDV